MKQQDVLSVDSMLNVGAAEFVPKSVQNRKHNAVSRMTKLGSARPRHRKLPTDQAVTTQDAGERQKENTPADKLKQNSQPHRHDKTQARGSRLGPPSHGSNGRAAGRNAAVCNAAGRNAFERNEALDLARQFAGLAGAGSTSSKASADFEKEADEDEAPNPKSKRDTKKVPIDLHMFLDRKPLNPVNIESQRGKALTRSMFIYLCSYILVIALGL